MTAPHPIPPMNAGEFCSALRKLNFTKQGFARFIKRDGRTIRHWAADSGAPVPTEIAALLRLLVRFNIEAPAGFAKR